MVLELVLVWGTYFHVGTEAGVKVQLSQATGRLRREYFLGPGRDSADTEIQCLNSRGEGG